MDVWNAGLEINRRETFEMWRNDSTYKWCEQNEGKRRGRRDMISDMRLGEEEDVIIAGKINDERDREYRADDICEQGRIKNLMGLGL